MAGINDIRQKSAKVCVVCTAALFHSMIYKQTSEPRRLNRRAKVFCETI